MATNSSGPKTVEQYLSARTDFNSLSFQDLLEARELFHAHLINKRNVVATAIGRYRIRTSDPWPRWATRSSTVPEAAVATPVGSTEGSIGAATPPKPRPPRTLDNSEVRPYSWPALLVFVAHWVDENDFGTKEGQVRPTDRLPDAVYMPDGRQVPICVVEAPPDETESGVVVPPAFPEHIIGGGYPVLADVQGEEHFASIACLVTDGHLVYALTNRHVSGEPGEPIYTLLAGEKVRIGQSAQKQETRRPFQNVYPGWPGRNVYVNLDVGLIQIDDKTKWTAQVYGLGQLGELADLNQGNISLRLIGCPVRAFGAASREMTGEIAALFYRFKSVGGFEYVSDLLIGPRGDRPLSTHPGDSGTLWVLDVDSSGAPPMPLAIQWGGNVFADRARKGRQTYALATWLSTVCNLLDVDLIREWNVGLPYYWGAIGHYSIANMACDAIQSDNLKMLMRANLERITYPTQVLTGGEVRERYRGQFVPLADVADIVWKIPIGVREPARYMRPDENPNHYADMDQKTSDGTTLLQICQSSPDNVMVPAWQRYYDEVHDADRGLLPFRVWQIYDAMVEFVKAGKVTEFVCAAGILAHYVGDACQPLHISYLFNGDPSQKVVNYVHHRNGEVEQQQVERGKGVHSAYESYMVNRYATNIIEGVQRTMQGANAIPTIQGGHNSAVKVVELMQKTFDMISPGDIVDVYAQVARRANDDSAPVLDTLWDRFGDKTIQVITRGCQYLAMIWDSAWQEGDGDSTIGPGRLGAVNPDDLANLYLDPRFLESHKLDTIQPLLKGA